MFFSTCASRAGSPFQRNVDWGLLRLPCRELTSDDIFPNLSTALRLFFTISVMMAPSKLRVQVLQSSMGQQWLSDLIKTVMFR